MQFEECKDDNEIVDEILKGEESKILTDKLEVHIIDLHKFKKIKEPKVELADWINLILGNEEGIEMSSKRNEMISKINEENKELSKDQELKQRLRELSIQMAIMDENTRRAYEEEEREQRRKELEEATKEAKEKAIKEGIKQGKKEGERKKQVEIAKKMLTMNIPIKQIAEATELTKEEVEEL